MQVIGRALLMAWGVLAPLLGIALLLGITPGLAQDVRRFDGAWTATLVCESTPSGLPGWRYEFSGGASNGIFHGQRGPAGKPGSETFDGSIKADGSANISQIGFSGDSQKDPFHRPEGTEFRNPYAGSFDGSHGRLTRLNRTSCNIDLSRPAEGQRLVKRSSATTPRGPAIARPAPSCEIACTEYCLKNSLGGSAQNNCTSGCVPHCYMKRAGSR